MSHHLGLCMIAITRVHREEKAVGLHRVYTYHLFLCVKRRTKVAEFVVCEACLFWMEWSKIPEDGST